MKKYFLMLLPLLFLLGSCREDQKKIQAEASAELAVSLNFGGSAMALFDTVSLAAGEDFYLSLFRLYLSELAVRQVDGSWSELAPVLLVSPGDPAEAPVSLSLPAGGLEALRVGFGVDALQNDADPASFANDHPLSSFQSMYWTMLKYRFAKFEGTAMLPDTVVSVAYHPGTDPLYQLREFELASTFSINSAANYRLLLDFDLAVIFNGPAGRINLPADAQTHSEAAHYELARRFMENLAASASLTLQEY